MGAFRPDGVYVEHPDCVAQPPLALAGALSGDALVAHVAKAMGEIDETATGVVFPRDAEDPSDATCPWCGGLLRHGARCYCRRER